MRKVLRLAGAAFAVVLATTAAATAGHAIAQHFAAQAQEETAPMADETAMPTAPDLSSSASRLAELRKHLRPYWVPIEAGGIFLATGPDEDENERFVKALAARVPQLAQIVPDQRPAELWRMLTRDVRAFLATGKLAPGAYQLDNYHLDYAEDGKLTFNSDGDPPTDLPAEHTFTFAVTEEHLKLLRHLNTQEWMAIMDAKRPYGDMTYYFIDMAEALGEALPPHDARHAPAFAPQQIERYRQLHREMLFAAQAFWRYAQ